MPRPLLFAAALCFSTALACSTNPATGEDAGTDAGGNDAGNSDAGANDAGNSDAGNADASCSPSQVFGGGETSAVGGSVSGTLVNQDGGSVAGQPLYICGLNLCSDPAVSGAQGQVSISTNLTEKKPAFKFGDSISYAIFAIPLTEPTTALGTLTDSLLPSTGQALTPGTTAVSGEVAVAISASASVGIDTLVYTTADQQAWRTAAIPVALAGPQLASAQVNGASAKFGLLYGVAPSGTTVCPPAKLTVALPHTGSGLNDSGWAANAAVEFWVHGTDSGQTWAPYAGWAKISDGAVSSNGATVSTADGQGFPYLTTFAVRLQ